jgi:hypothetical protein
VSKQTKSHHSAEQELSVVRTVCTEDNSVAVEAVEHFGEADAKPQASSALGSAVDVVKHGGRYYKAYCLAELQKSQQHLYHDLKSKPKPSKDKICNNESL